MDSEMIKAKEISSPDDLVMNYSAGEVKKNSQQIEVEEIEVLVVEEE